MFAPGLVPMIIALAMSATTDLEQQAVDAARAAVPGIPAIAAPAKPRRVMSWVPPYATEESLAALKQMHARVGPANSLTHLGLQFWWPKADGSVRYSTDGEVNDGTVRNFVAWAHAHKIKVLLCVYNAMPDWDWARAKKAFAGNRARFVAALAAEVKRLGLDGVDVDFEGDDVDSDGQFNGDKGAYVAFIKALRAELNKAGKELTVDAFSDIYNAPNTGWWADLFPHVDGLTSMGYAEIGRNGKGPAAYGWQLRHAGKYAARLQIGLPSDKSVWQGNNAADQTAWFLTTKRVGVAVWDAQFSATAWQQPPVWRNLHKLRLGQ
jgi:hypothetical protein